MYKPILFLFHKSQYKEIQFQKEYKGKILDYNNEHGFIYIEILKNKIKI
jgi:hypothetical protein